MTFKPPTWKRTFEFIKRLVNSDDYAPGLIAQKCGVERETVDAWTRPKESDEYPTGTGKNNPSDTVIRLIGLAHAKDPALAMEWAQTFPEYVGFLNGEVGKSLAKESPCEVVARIVKEHADLIVEYTKTDEPDYERLLTEATELQVQLVQFIACCQEHMKND